MPIRIGMPRIPIAIWILIRKNDANPTRSGSTTTWFQRRVNVRPPGE